MKNARRTFAIVLASALLAFVACGDSEPQAEPESPSPAESSESPAEAPTEEPSEEPAETTSLEVWFATSNGLFVTLRTVEQTPAIGRAAVEQLLSGPSSIESDAGVSSAIPEGTELLGLDVSDGVATVDLSGEFESGGGSASMLMRVAQVVYTLTQFPTVQEVQFQLEGEPVEALGGEGLILDTPQRRKDYRDQLPPILVETPVIGASVEGTFEVAGTANVFEATVSIRVVDASGEVLLETFTTATCGTGCRGDYREMISLDVAEETEVVLEVFESSAEDGSPLFMVEIPLTVRP
jgi:spore germination protein GerM